MPSVITANRLSKWQALLPLIVLAYLGYTFYVLKDYIQLTTWQGLAILAYVFISRINREKKINWWMLCISIAFLFLYFQYHTISFLFLSIILFLIETVNAYIGRVNSNAHLLLLMCSPLFKYAITVFGFPLRLKLSAFAAQILSWGVDSIQTSGNIILINGHEFAVDDACAGLHMLTASFIFTLLLIEIFRTKSKKEIFFPILSGIYFLMLILNLVGNLCRICTLTLLKIYPENPMHEYVGLICFCLYNLLPVYFMIRYFFSAFGKVQEQKQENNPVQSIWPKLILIGTALTGMCIIINQQSLPVNQELKTLVIPGLQHYEKETVEHNILKYHSKDALIYVKPLGYFYSTEHNPLFCWTGSGYIMQQFDLKKAGKQEVYVGKLVKGKQILYTAWYYTNGKSVTYSQWDWRVNSIKENLPYYLVNVSATTEGGLFKLLEDLI